TAEASPAHWAAHGAAHWAALGGVEVLTEAGAPDPAAWLARARFVDPWRGTPCGAEQGLEALTFLRRAALANARQAVTVGFSRWRRRNATPFLTGPAGPPLHRATEVQATRTARRIGGRLAVWGMRELEASDAPEAVRLEDGFVRSVGLGLQHAPPASLAVDREGLYFDASRPTDFERIAREATFTPALLARAKALRERLVALRITKYNLARSEPLPEAPAGRRRILVPGQVEGDASLRWGSPDVHRNAELIRRARARSPDAFLLYKPHPDVLTGLRRGAVDEATLALADGVAAEASAAACLDWADEVETMTSLMGFEALLRGRAVATHGRPFYAGWGLTTTAGAAFDRGRTLSLDALTAAALILYPRYIDPATRLPAPPERVLEWLHEERAFVSTPQGRARQAWRMGLSRLLNLGRRG
ncbi:MAG: capsular biosynthesis protein, partial [Pseudomonadota bacterium]